MVDSRMALKAAALTGTALLLAGCYTVLTHPHVVGDQQVETEPEQEVAVETSRSCLDCHTAYYADPYYHWPFHYYDPPVGSWIYREHFYGWPLYSVTYYDRHQYYSSYPWWWNTRFHPAYRYPDRAKYTYPRIEPSKRDWGRGRTFDQRLPAVGIGARTGQGSDSAAQPTKAPTGLQDRPTTTEVSGSADDEDDEEEETNEGADKGVSEQTKRSPRRKTTQ